MKRQEENPGTVGKEPLEEDPGAVRGEGALEEEPGAIREQLGEELGAVGGEPLEEEPGWEPLLWRVKVALGASTLEVEGTYAPTK